MKAYTHILVPTDGSTLSLKAARQAATLAKDLKAKITAVYVIPPWTPPIADESVYVASLQFSEQAYRESVEAKAAKALAKVAAAAAESKVACDKVFVDGAQPWESIVKTAKSKKCDLIVMASHGRSPLGGFVLGSETTKVLHHSKTPVLVCR